MGILSAGGRGLKRAVFTVIPSEQSGQAKPSPIKVIGRPYPLVVSLSDDNSANHRSWFDRLTTSGHVQPRKDPAMAHDEQLAQRVRQELTTRDGN